MNYFLSNLFLKISIESSMVIYLHSVLRPVRYMYQVSLLVSDSSKSTVLDLSWGYTVVWTWKKGGTYKQINNKLCITFWSHLLFLHILFFLCTSHRKKTITIKIIGQLNYFTPNNYLHK